MNNRDEVDDIELLKKQVRNTQKALLALWAMTDDLAPPCVYDDVHKMMEAYFDANQSLGMKMDPEQMEFETGDTDEKVYSS